MNRIRRQLTLTIAMLGAGSLVGTSFAQGKGKGKAKHNHHDGKQMLGANIKGEGSHVLHKNGNHTVSLDVKNGKVAGMHVKHAKNGDVPVTKYKTKQKMVQANGLHYASLQLAQLQDLGTTYIGYAYTDEYGNVEIYWFPYEMIYDGDTGAIEYVPIY